ncbi:hypothetical protein QAD02_010370 [Eretmocerus hayati]|uniref:Uncharacterized protein n=1 Tax=Eretmocerus hayati TaxID=131215 RepID=A0ACC2NCB0_9HYME|nr:hypothetical protein QAD02_010370 [Eretmocerus hayati]
MPLRLLSTVIGAVGCAARRLYFFLDWALLQLKYNHVAVSGIIQDRLQARYNRTELPKMTGKVAIVTGGSRGIGLEAVRMLLQCDLEVIIACRSVAAGKRAIQTIRDSGVQLGKARVLELDNSSFDSIKNFARTFQKDYEKLDILINNAGIMFIPYRETVEGFEEQYGVNYLSHFLLTMLLMPQLKKAGSAEHHSRIVNVSSCAHYLGDIRFDDINHKRYFLTGNAYSQSKLAQLLSTKKLARLFAKKNLPINVYAVHPGVVATDIFDNSYIKIFKMIGHRIFKSPEEGATPIVFAAVDPRVKNKSGLYLSNCLEARINPLGADEKLQDKLFEFSLQQLQSRDICIQEPFIQE